MGIYTDIDVDVRIPEENIQKFKAEIEKLKEQEKIEDKEQEECWFVFFDDIDVDKYGNITFKEYTRKWYDPEPLYDLLARYGAEGSIMCHSEAGEWWGVVFKDGKWKEGDVAIQVNMQDDDMDMEV